MTQALRDLGEFIAAQLPDAVSRREVAHGELMLWTTRPKVIRLLGFLRDTLAAGATIDPGDLDLLTVTDSPSEAVAAATAYVSARRELAERAPKRSRFLRE